MPSIVSYHRLAMQTVDATSKVCPETVFKGGS